MKMWRKVLGLILCMSVLFGQLPMQAAAQEEQTGQAVQTESTGGAPEVTRLE